MSDEHERGQAFEVLTQILYFFFESKRGGVVAYNDSLYLHTQVHMTCCQLRNFAVISRQLSDNERTTRRPGPLNWLGSHTMPTPRIFNLTKPSVILFLNRQ